MATLLAKTLSRNLVRPILLQSTSYFQSSHYHSEIPGATYGGRHTVTLIPSHGINPGLITGIEDVFKSAGVPVDFERVDLVGDTPEEILQSFDDVKMAIRRNGVALKGSWITDMGRITGKSFNVALRHDLDLYANIVRCRSFPTVKTRHTDVDLVIVRENTEGEYSNLEHENVPGVIEMMKIITAKRSMRIAKYAFEFARQNERSKVTAVHKANIMKMSDGLFLSCCQEVSKDYPDIEFQDMIIDNCAMQMVSKPEQFDVMVMPNLYGNVVTNIAAALVGGPGIPSGENSNESMHVFESGTRNSGKEITGKNIANPMSVLFASTSMLRHLGLTRHAHLIDVCIQKNVVSGKARTQDIGGEATTSEFFNVLIDSIENLRNIRKTYAN